MDNKHSTACLHTSDVNPVRAKCGVKNPHVSSCKLGKSTYDVCVRMALKKQCEVDLIVCK